MPKWWAESTGETTEFSKVGSKAARDRPGGPVKVPKSRASGTGDIAKFAKVGSEAARDRPDTSEGRNVASSRNGQGAGASYIIDGANQGGTQRGLGL